MHSNPFKYPIAAAFGTAIFSLVLSASPAPENPDHAAPTATVKAQTPEPDESPKDAPAKDAASATPAAADSAPSGSPSAQDAVAPPPPATPPIFTRGSANYDRKESLPNVNVYLPEGQASVRLRKLIRNVLFESQIDYRFVNGDISTFLRYKYYARNFTYRLGVFDQISFPDIGSHSGKEFERVRGGLLLFELPRNYNNRYYWLLQDDRLTFGTVNDPDNRKNNTYTKIGYQFGTEFDERLNSIVGETRGRRVPVLTAFRELGPQKFSFALGATESARIGTGDYRYTKIEGEALKRSNFTETSFLITRLHAGIFPTRGTVSPVPVPVDRNGDGVLDPVSQYEYYTIPRYELFGLGGRDALRSVSDSLDTEGTHEAHLTNEVFVPVFRNQDHRTWVAHWNTLYGVGYLGAGGVAFDARNVIKSNNVVVDAGIGTEASISIRDFEVLLSVLYAHTVHAPDALKRGRVSFSIRTLR